MFHSKFDKQNKTWSGMRTPPLFHPKISVGQVLFKSLTSNGSRIAQISADSCRRYTFNDIRVKAVRAAQNLLECGYQPKDVFGFIAKNSENLAPIVLASVFLGCPISTLDPSFGRTETLHMFQITSPRVVFCDVETYDLVSACLDDLGSYAKIYTFGGQTGNSRPVESLFIETYTENNFTPVNVDGENDVLIVVCSSGTTGLPKGVSLSHAAVLDQVAQFNSLNAEDVLLCFNSLYWLTAFMVLTVGTYYGGTRVITKQLFSPELQLRLIERYKVTLCVGAPYHLTLLLGCEAIKRTDLSSMKCYMVGGGKIPSSVPIEMNKYLPNGKVRSIYGMSEAAGFISTEVMGTNKCGSAGQLVNCVTVKIVDLEGRRCDVGIDGEICIKLNYKFLGYYGNKTATSEVFDDEGFLMTGDVGHFDGDGFLYLVDRKKDLLKYQNFQISPSEIEAFLIRLPQIKLVCVVGVPDDAGGDLIAAVVVRNSQDISEKEIYDAVANRFADCKKLRGGVHFVDSLPTTPSGKVVRRLVKEIATKQFDKIHQHKSCQNIWMT